jgi:ParD-like antitoxin of type II bacterial toxin-antitoxin system
MSHPVKLSEELVLDARLTAEVAERSIAAQIEFWAQLGRAIEPLLKGDTALALKRTGAARPLSEAIAEVGTRAGQERLDGYLQGLPFPHYEPAQEPGWLVRIDRDGTRTTGRFVNRIFEPR